jgi:regulator of RNase E activity RraA
MDPGTRTRTALTRLSVSALCDALGGLVGHPCHLTGLVSPVPDRVLSGPAATLAFLPARDDRPAGDFAGLVVRAAGDAPAGRVLVAGVPGHPDAAVAGGMKLSRVADLGMAGILTDARLRDFAEVRELGIAAWCRGETVRQGGALVSPVDAGVPVAMGGVTVVPGDWVHADASGAVVIPARALDEVISAARAKEERDAAAVIRMRAELRS